MSDLSGVGQRRRITVDGEHYYLIVTREAATLSINAVEAWG